MEDPALHEKAMSFKDAATTAFKAKNCKEAERLYGCGLSYAQKVKNVEQVHKDLCQILNQNIALMCNQQEKYREAIAHCTAALEIAPTSVKALYQRSIAFGKSSKFDEAADDCKAAIKLSPQDKNLRTHYEALKAEQKKASAGQKQAMKKFFEQGVYSEKAAPSKRSVYDELPAFNPANPQTFFDMEIGEEGSEHFQKGRVVFELFMDKTPISSENFRALCADDFPEKAPSFTFCTRATSSIESSRAS